MFSQMPRRRKKLCVALAVLFAFNVFVILAMQSADAASYQKGSSGETVRQIQTKLSDRGYYSGSVDGIYGSATVKAER